MPLASPIDEAHGVDPKEPKTTLEVPSVASDGRDPEVVGQKKKAANVVLVLDTSGSMNEGAKNPKRARRRETVSESAFTGR